MPEQTDLAVLTVAEAADELGVAPARVRALLSRGALTPAPGDGTTVLAADVAELSKRGTVRAVDATAVEAAVDRALRRRLPGLLEGGLAPVAGEVATALADVEASTRELAAAEERSRAAEAALAAAETRIAGLDRQVRVLTAQVVALQSQPVGLFRRRRTPGPVPV